MPSTGRLSPDQAALVVVDFQEKLTPAVVDHGQVVRNALLLLRLARTLGLPVVLTTQYARGLGPTIPEVLSAAGVAPLDKVSFGCFGDPAFADHLHALAGRRQLVVTGIESHICVAQTVFGALDAGYEVHVAATRSLRVPRRTVMWDSPGWNGRGRSSRAPRWSSTSFSAGATRQTSRRCFPISRVTSKARR